MPTETEIETRTPTAAALKAAALADLDRAREFFDRSTRCLEEKDSGSRATSETWTVATQLAHVAQTIDWFAAGAFDGNWRMDFEVMAAEAETVTSLNAARAELSAAWQRLRDRLEAASEESLVEPLEENPILGCKPRYMVVQSVAEHTAHHRGSLAVYSRLLGHTPPIPYMDT